MQLFAALRTRSLPAFLEGIRHNPHHLLLDPLSTWLMSLVSSEVFWLRLPSAAWGLAGVWAVYRLGARQDERLGLLAALLLAVSPMHVEWSRRVDFYAASAALSALQTLAFLERRERAYTVLAAVHLLTHPYAALTFLAHRWWRPWLAAAAVALPWWLYSARHMLSPARLEGPSLPAFLAGLPSHLSAQSEVAGPAMPIVGALFVALYGVSLWRCKLPAVVHVSVLGGLTAIIAVDLAFDVYFAPRQAIWLLPFFLLGVADGALALAPRAAWVLAALPLIAAVRSTEQSRQAGKDLAVLVAQVPRDAALAFDDSLAAHSFLYHWDRRAFAAQRGFRAVELPGSGPEWRFAGPLHDLTVTPPSVSRAR